jgi:Zn-finger nucleic acid-binding protein
MTCTSCGRELPVGFPGATVSCVCGHRASLPSPIPAVQRAGPYRGGQAAPPGEGTDILCPYCSNRCPALARVCPHCDVRLENVRCARCYSLQQPGAFHCQRCGQPLELEPMLDATDAPCPRCQTPLEAAATGDDGRLHECPRCGGVFVPKDVLAELLLRAELSGPFSDPPKRQIPSLDDVRYVPCPQCHSSMNRMNFGRVSGVIVDVCKPHGTWFDGGELTRVIAFAAGGGLVKTRAREAEDQKLQAKEREKLQQDFAVMHGRLEAEEKLREWRFLLRDFFFW